MTEQQPASEKQMIHPAMIAIMRAVCPVAKGSKSEQGYTFRGIDAIYKELSPLFKQHGIYSTSEVVENTLTRTPRGNNKPDLMHSLIRVRYTYHAEDGSQVSTEVIGEGTDYGGDKSMSKAMSMADKTALIQMLKIPVDGPEPSSGGIKQTTTTSGGLTKEQFDTLRAKWRSETDESFHTVAGWKQYVHVMLEIDDAQPLPFDPTKREEWTKDRFDMVMATVNPY